MVGRRQDNTKRALWVIARRRVLLSGRLHLASRVDAPGRRAPVNLA